MTKMVAFEKFFVNSWWDKIFHKFFGVGRLLQSVPLEEFGDILEIGAGVGITTEFIKKKFPSARITATDYDPDQVSQAKKRLAYSNVVAEQADATQLPFSDKSFDACFAILVFHHIENFPKALTEISRVLKPGGKFYVIDVQNNFLPLLHLRSSLLKRIAPGLFTREEFENYVIQSGFRVLQGGGKRMFWLTAQKINF